jgi:hypothetical protein
MFPCLEKQGGGCFVPMNDPKKRTVIGSFFFVY